GTINLQNGATWNVTTATQSYANNIATDGGIIKTDTNLTLSGSIGGSGSLTKDGTGSLTLNGALSFSGDLNVLHGTVTLTSALSNGGATNLSAGTTLNLSQAVPTPTAAPTINIYNGGSSTSLAGDIVAVTGVNMQFNTGTYGGGGNLKFATSGSSLLGAGNTGSLNNAVYLNNNIVLNSSNISGTFKTYIGMSGTSSSLHFESVISDTATSTTSTTGKADVEFGAGPSGGGSAPIYLDQVNTYHGNTYVVNGSGGTITLGIDNALPATTTLFFGDGAISGDTSGIDLKGHNQSLAGINTSTLLSGQNGGGFTNTGSNVSDTTFKTLSLTGGPGAGTIVKFNAPIQNLIILNLTSTYAGTLRLTENNTYSGGTVLSGGVLQFGPTYITPVSLRTVTPTPALGLITINAGGTLAVGGDFTTVSGATTGWLTSGKIDSSSTGVIALTGDSSEAVNFTGFANLSLGAAKAKTNAVDSSGNLIDGTGIVNFTGSLTPAASTYRLGGGGGTLNYKSNLVDVGGPTALAISGAGTVSLQGTVSYTGGTTVAVGKLIIVGTTAASAQTIAGPVSISAGGLLDLQKNSLIIKGGSLDDTGAIRQALLGCSLTSSTATANRTGLGYLTGTQYLALHPTATGISAGDIVVRYTFLGDTTLKGSINAVDFAQLDASYLKHIYNGGTTDPKATWINGDFNYDGQITAADFTIIDAAYANQAGGLANDPFLASNAALLNLSLADYTSLVTAQLSDSNAVPEPASLAMLGLGAVALLRRRR
ncbi:MAG: autotransporter-associated beta strand repeat-containing protein, partial [Phycisphaerae bacterium]